MRVEICKREEIILELFSSSSRDWSDEGGRDPLYSSSNDGWPLRSAQTQFKRALFSIKKLSRWRCCQSADMSNRVLPSLFFIDQRGMVNNLIYSIEFYDVFQQNSDAGYSRVISA